MIPLSRLAALLGSLAIGQANPPRSRRKMISRQSGWTRWLGEPRNAVFFVLASAILFGGGRKLLQGWRARRAVGRLNLADPTANEIEATSQFGRAGLIDLFRILGTAEQESIREAAGRAIARLWAQDELVKEEETALIRRGFQVTWKARRRFPRKLEAPIPVRVSYGVPFLREGAGVGPENLEWSHRILGAQRAGLETYSPWQTGSAHPEFTLIPTDFETNGPHKLVLQARVRTKGLTDMWELELPHIPFQFEFDPKLTPESLFALPDATREEAVIRSIQWKPLASDDELQPARYLPLNDELALREPPDLFVTSTFPCDLAHRIEVEFEGVEGRYPAGSLIYSGDSQGSTSEETRQSFELSSFDHYPIQAVDRPGTRRMRLVLTADPHLGWANPDIRSIWPGAITTEWVEVRIVRR